MYFVWWWLLQEWSKCDLHTAYLMESCCRCWCFHRVWEHGDCSGPCDGDVQGRHLWIWHSLSYHLPADKDKNIQNREILWQCGRKHINGWLASFNLKVFLFSLLASQILSMDHKTSKLLTFAPGSWRCSGSPSVMQWPAATATTSQSSTSMCLTSKSLRQRNSSKPLLTTPCEVFGPSWPSGWG